MAPRRFWLFCCLLKASGGFWWLLLASGGFWWLLVVSGLWLRLIISYALLISRCSHWPLLIHVGSVGCCSWSGGASSLLAVVLPSDGFWWFLVASGGFWWSLLSWLLKAAGDSNVKVRKLRNGFLKHSVEKLLQFEATKSHGLFKKTPFS